MAILCGNRHLQVQTMPLTLRFKKLTHIIQPPSYTHPQSTQMLCSFPFLPQNTFIGVQFPLCANDSLYLYQRWLPDISSVQVYRPQQMTRSKDSSWRSFCGTVATQWECFLGAFPGDIVLYSVTHLPSSPCQQCTLSERCFDQEFLEKARCSSVEHAERKCCILLWIPKPIAPSTCCHFPTSRLSLFHKVASFFFPFSCDLFYLFI